MPAKPADQHQFYSEMAKLLEAGFGIREAADVLSGTGVPAAQARLLDELRDGLNAGKSIADSLGGNHDTVSDLERGIITAGERGGRLAPALAHLADYFGMLATARSEVLKGLVHPTLVLHIGVFIGTVPTAMIAGGKTMAQTAGGFFTTLAAAYVAVILMFVVVRALLRAARGNPRVDGLLRRFPWFGKTRNDMAMAGFCKVYHTCLLAGLPMVETVRMAADASQSGMIREAAGRLRETLSHGLPLGPRMMTESAFPPSFARSYSTGETAGTLDKDLALWSNRFQHEAEEGVKTLAAVVPRMLYFIMLAYVGWKIVGFYDSYYGRILKELG